MAIMGAGEILLTSMDRDGTRRGFDLDLLRAVCSSVTIPVVASGGVGSLRHFVEGAQAGATGLLAASVFHFGQFTIAEVKAGSGRGPPSRPPAPPATRINDYAQSPETLHRRQQGARPAKSKAVAKKAAARDLVRVP